MLGVGYLAGLPLGAFLSYVTAYPWDALKLQRCLISSPRDRDVSHAVSMEGWDALQPGVSGAELLALQHILQKNPEFGLGAASHCLLTKHA